MLQEASLLLDGALNWKFSIFSITNFQRATSIWNYGGIIKMVIIMNLLNFQLKFLEIYLNISLSELRILASQNNGSAVNCHSRWKFYSFPLTCGININFYETWTQNLIQFKPAKQTQDALYLLFTGTFICYLVYLRV